MPAWTYGMFVWRELSTSDVQGALRFYAGLFGWNSKKVDMPNGAYHLLHKAEKQVGGLMALEKGVDMPPYWMSYLSVPNVDAALRSAKKLGAEVVWGPLDVEEIGRMATVVDPRGAAFSLMKAVKGDPVFEAPQLGEFCWEQLASHDLPTARAFYADVAGWQAQPFPEQGYEVLGLGSGPGEQAATLVPSTPPLSAGWLSFVSVEELEKACKRTTQLGGKVLSDPIVVQGIGRYVVIADPQGARLGLFQ